VGLQPVKSPKLVIFNNNNNNNAICIAQIRRKQQMTRGAQAQLETFLWYKFAPKGYTPLSDFYKIWLGEGLPGLHPHAKVYRCGFKNVGL